MEGFEHIPFTDENCLQSDENLAKKCKIFKKISEKKKKLTMHLIPSITIRKAITYDTRLTQPFEKAQNLEKADREMLSSNSNTILSLEKRSIPGSESNPSTINLFSDRSHQKKLKI